VATRTPHCPATRTPRWWPWDLPEASDQTRGTTDLGRPATDTERELFGFGSGCSGGAVAARLPNGWVSNGCHHCDPVLAAGTWGVVGPLAGQGQPLRALMTTLGCAEREPAALDGLHAGEDVLVHGVRGCGGGEDVASTRGLEGARRRSKAASCHGGCHGMPRKKSDRWVRGIVAHARKPSSTHTSRSDRDLPGRGGDNF
jgi:hypothetical protein